MNIKNWSLLNLEKVNGKSESFLVFNIQTLLKTVTTESSSCSKVCSISSEMELREKKKVLNLLHISMPKI